MTKKTLQQYVRQFPGKKAIVLGDVMLDKYIWGRATRISPEAPVPVVQVKRQNAVPGGAANVARNILSLGGNVEVASVCGKDLDGESLRGLLAGDGAGVRGLFPLNSRPTTAKTRVLAGNQQVVRIDQEQTEQLSSAARRKIREAIEDFLDDDSVGALILEDYAKGVFSKSFMQRMIDLARERGKIVALDPHPKGQYPVRNLTFMTPNRSEAFALAGVEDRTGGGSPLNDKALLQTASILMTRWQMDYLLITLGADGMVLFQPNAAPVHIPTEARQVFDVSGAGDTVMATMVLSLLAGASPEEAARIANCAAGVVVGRVGTSAIESDVLLAELNRKSVAK